jgi:hypothetical protein
VSQWSANGTNATVTPIWVPALVSKTANVTNQQAMYANVSANAFVNGQVVSVVSVDASEIAVNKECAHTGHHLRKVGTGGRAGRVQYECLVAGGVTGDNAGDALQLPNTVANGAAVVIDFNPQGGDISDGTANVTVRAHTVPGGLPILYLWHGSGGALTPNATNGANTATLNLADTGANTVYRCNVYVNATVGVFTTNVAVTA